MWLFRWYFRFSQWFVGGGCQVCLVASAVPCNIADARTSEVDTTIAPLTVESHSDVIEVDVAKYAPSCRLYYCDM